MNKIFLLLALIQGCFLWAQPGSRNTTVNPTADNRPFIHCTTDEKHFASYAVEAQPGTFELMQTIHGKLHIPKGLNQIWKDATNSKAYQKGEYNYAQDFWIGIRFNFYVGGVLVSTAFEEFEKPQNNQPFTYTFTLEPLDVEQSEGDLRFAYIKLLENIKNQGSQLVIEAALASKTLNHKRFAPIANSVFYLRYTDTQYAQWSQRLSQENPGSQPQVERLEPPGENNISENFNIRLKHAADSTMKQIFGEAGFSQNFTMTCFQNPCEPGYLYANTFVSQKPCSTEPQNNCKEALVTYSFVQKDVPLSVKIRITLKDNGTYADIENNPFYSGPVSLDQQNLLSTTEIQKIIAENFRKDSLEILPYGNALVYYNSRIQQPEFNKKDDKFARDPGYRLIEESKAGALWEHGFVYIARSNRLKDQTRVHHFDAISGDLLWITEVYAIAE